MPTIRRVDLLPARFQKLLSRVCRASRVIRQPKLKGFVRSGGRYSCLLNLEVHTIPSGLVLSFIDFNLRVQMYCRIHQDCPCRSHHIRYVMYFGSKSGSGSLLNFPRQPHLYAATCFIMICDVLWGSWYRSWCEKMWIVVKILYILIMCNRKSTKHK